MVNNQTPSNNNQIITKHQITNTLSDERVIIQTQYFSARLVILI